MTVQTDASARGKARIAGALYLTIIAGGLFAQVAVRQPLTVGGDAAATARAIAADEQLWRAGLAVHLGYLLANVPLAFATTRFWHEQVGLPMSLAAPIASVCMLALNFILGRWAIAAPKLKPAGRQ